MDLRYGVEELGYKKVPVYGLNETKVRNILAQKGLNQAQQDTFLFGIPSADPMNNREVKKREAAIANFLPPEKRHPRGEGEDIRSWQYKIEDRNPKELAMCIKWTMKNNIVKNLRISGVRPQEAYDNLLARKLIDPNTPRPLQEVKWDQIPTDGNRNIAWYPYGMGGLR